MDSPLRDDPEIVTYKIPRIEVYQVMDDELGRIAEGYGQVGIDFSPALFFGAIVIGVLTTLITATLTESIQRFLIVSALVFGVLFVFTGARWLTTKKSIPKVISKIRSRRVEPETIGPKE